jgi:acyl-CoA dehydrogenase
MTDLLRDALERLFESHATPAQVRAIEASGDARALWAPIEEGGFAHALVPEGADGAGLGLADIFPSLMAAGAQALPVPLGLTMLARALLAEAGQAIPEGAITIAAGIDSKGVAARLPYARTAQWALVDFGAALALAPIEAVAPDAGQDRLGGDVVFAQPTRTFRHGADLRAMAAAVLAAQMAGALVRVFEDTIRYANERVQFGKPIGKFQALQQQLSAMAEQVFAARMAAELAFSGPGLRPDPLRAAMAKARAGEAAVKVAATAHAVHGAMGITEEFDLQLLTRRLHGWRLAYGADRYWSAKLGQAALAHPEGGTLDFIRTRLMS